MAYETDIPPHQSANPMHPVPVPPEDSKPNTAMLKGDIDSGRTGDKTEVFDPGMAMLGTCEEAGGNALTPDQIALARREEAKNRWSLGSRKTNDAHNHSNLALYGFAGFIAVVAAVLVGVFAVG